MSFLDFLFQREAPNTGYIFDDENWIQGLPKHEIFAGGGENVDWEPLAPSFRSQESTMMCTAFAGSSIASIMNAKETGEKALFSPMELFTRSNGNTSGNSVQNTFDAMKAGLMLESKCPWIGQVDSFNAYNLKLMGAYADAKRELNGLSTEFAVKDLAWVNQDRNSMRQALTVSPLMLIINVGNGYFGPVAPAVSNGAAHAVVALRIDGAGRIRIFDSLTNKQGFDGFRWLSADFPVLYAFSFIDLPNNWQNKQNGVLNRYGKPQVFWIDTQTAAMLGGMKKNNPTHASFIDSGWYIYLNAMGYGGYSSVDILNHISMIRRTGKGIFDFNYPKK